MEDTKVTLSSAKPDQFTVTAIPPICHIDFDAVRTLEDVKDILKGMQITVYDDGTDRFAPMRRFLVPNNKNNEHERSESLS